jgi:hypothetical protein
VALPKLDGSVNGLVFAPSAQVQVPEALCSVTVSAQETQAHVLQRPSAASA